MEHQKADNVSDEKADWYKRIPTKESAMNEQKKKALIIGCGIAGPAVALFLKRAGFEAEIFEARKTPEGFALSLSSNGVEVLKMLRSEERRVGKECRSVV